MSCEHKQSDDKDEEYDYGLMDLNFIRQAVGFSTFKSLPKTNSYNDVHAAVSKGISGRLLAIRKAKTNSLSIVIFLPQCKIYFLFLIFTFVYA